MCLPTSADPGYEFKETLETGAAAAAAGGYTDIMVIPNTNPCIHNKSGIEYIVQKSKSLPVTIHPIGAITKNTEGKDLAEMYDMRAQRRHCFQRWNQLCAVFRFAFKSSAVHKNFSTEH